MLKLCLIGPYPEDPSKVVGGVSAATLYLVQGLKKHLDIDLHILVATKNTAQSMHIQDNRTSIHYIKEPKQKLIPNQIASVYRLSKLIDRIDPDIVHSETSVGTLAGIKTNRPTIHTIHGIPRREIQFAQSVRQRFELGLQCMQTNKAVRNARHIIAVSPYAAREYASITKAKIYQIYNAVDDHFFSIESQPEPERILYAGHISPLKNVLGLVRAFRQIRQNNPDAKLVIAGGVADQKYGLSISNYIEEHGLKYNVLMAGHLSQDSLEREYSLASVVCLFSLQEAAPVVIAQAMAAGKPVVASAAGGTPDLVADGETGFLVNIGDESALADRVLKLLSDQGLCRQFGSRGHDVAEERFRKEVVASRTIDVYKSIVDAD